MMGKKLKIIEKIGINFFWVGEDLGGGGEFVPKQTKTHYYSAEKNPKN